MRTKTPKLVLAAIFVALAVALSFAKLFEMPMGGSVTLGSMLPIFLLSITLGVKWGLAGSAVFKGDIEGNVKAIMEQFPAKG